MRNIFMMVLTVTLLANCTNQPNLTVEIDGWGNDTIRFYKYTWGEDKSKQDTLIAKNGVVTINLENENDTIDIFLEKTSGRIMTATSVVTTVYPGAREKIVGKLYPKYIDYTSKGNNSMFNEASTLRTKTIKYLIMQDSINYLINNSQGTTTKAIVNNLFAERGVIHDSLNAEYIRFVKQNPNSDVAAQKVVRFWNDMFFDTYDILGDDAKEGLYKNKLVKQRDKNIQYQMVKANRKNIKIGNKAPNFTLPFIDGGEKSLTDFRGKWVVLDFWGSWCGWCIVDFPKLKKVYSKHSDKLEILGLACNDKEDAWRQTVKKHELPWVQLFNDKQGAESVSVKYGITGYPTKIVIDPQGIIRNVTIGAQPTFYSELDKLVK